jgi:hypothetical protein
MELVYEFTFTAVLNDAVPVGDGPFGTRRIREVLSGEATGDRIRGTVGAGGADWLLVGPDGYGRLDVRLTLHTHDGADIYVQYFGLIEYTDARMPRTRENVRARGTSTISARAPGSRRAIRATRG